MWPLADSQPVQRSAGALWAAKRTGVLLAAQIDVNGQNQEVHRAILAGNTAFIFTNSSECLRVTQSRRPRGFEHRRQQQAAAVK